MIVVKMQVYTASYKPIYFQSYFRPYIDHVNICIIHTYTIYNTCIDVFMYSDRLVGNKFGCSTTSYIRT